MTQATGQHVVWLGHNRTVTISEDDYYQQGKWPDLQQSIYIHVGQRAKLFQFVS